jgi:hypothetical protein
MSRTNHTAAIGADSEALTIRPSGSILRVTRLPALTISRAIRFPFSSLTGLVVTIIAYLGVESLVPGEGNLLQATALQVFMGTISFLVLGSLMAFHHERPNYIGQHFRTGILVAAAVTVVVTFSIAVAFALAPIDFESSESWDLLLNWWPVTAHGIGVVSLACVLPAFFLAWPIRANTGLALGKSIMLVWRSVEGHSYPAGRFTFVLVSVGWVLLTIPGLGLLVPTLYAHLTAVLFEELIVVEST